MRTCSTSLKREEAGVRSTTLVSGIEEFREDFFFQKARAQFKCEGGECFAPWGKGRKLKSDKRWQGPGIIIARYGSTYALVHFRGAYLEASLGDMKSTDRILDVLGCDGTLQLHLANTKFSVALFGRFANVNFSFESEERNSNSEPHNAG